MSGSSKAGAASAVPAPPPPLDEAEEKFDLSDTGKRMWDLAAVYGPATRDALHAHRSVTSKNYREYVRFFPEFDGNTSTSVLARADIWMFDQSMDRAIERGWVRLDSQGLISSGDLPPNHVPLATFGSTAQLMNELTHVESAQALKIITAKNQAARMKPTAEGRARLTRSIKEHGQLEPIVMWKPHPMSKVDDVVVNGVTRLEILTKLGIEPVLRWLPIELTAAEVLLMRIEYEIAGSSKDTSKEGRDAYIAQLATQGVTQQEIAKAVGLSQTRISEIVSQYRSTDTRDKPSVSEVEEFGALRDAGWTLRDISTRTGWSKNTVDRYLASPDEAEAEPALPTGNARTMLDTLATLGTATQRETYEAAGLEQAAVAGAVNNLLRRGLVEKAGKGSSAKGQQTAISYRPTKKALELLPTPKSKATPFAPVLSIVPKPEADPLSAILDQILYLIDSSGISEQRVIAAIRSRVRKNG